MSNIIKFEDIKKSKNEDDEVVKTLPGFIEAINKFLKTYINNTTKGEDPIADATGSFGDGTKIIKASVRIFYSLKENGEKIPFSTYLKENETYLLSSKNNTEPTDTKIVSKHAFGILMSGLALNDMMAKPIVKFTSNIDKLILDTGKESLIFPIRYADNDKLFLGLVYSLESDNGDTVMLKLTFHIDSLVKE